MGKQKNRISQYNPEIDFFFLCWQGEHLSDNPAWDNNEHGISRAYASDIRGCADVKTEIAVDRSLTQGGIKII